MCRAPNEAPYPPFPQTSGLKACPSHVCSVAWNGKKAGRGVLLFCVKVERGCETPRRTAKLSWAKIPNLLAVEGFLWFSMVPCCFPCFSMVPRPPPQKKKHGHGSRRTAFNPALRLQLVVEAPVDLRDRNKGSAQLRPHLAIPGLGRRVRAVARKKQHRSRTKCHLGTLSRKQETKKEQISSALGLVWPSNLLELWGLNPSPVLEAKFSFQRGRVPNVEGFHANW